MLLASCRLHVQLSSRVLDLHIIHPGHASLLVCCLLALAAHAPTLHQAQYPPCRSHTGECLCKPGCKGCTIDRCCQILRTLSTNRAAFSKLLSASKMSQDFANTTWTASKARTRMLTPQSTFGSQKSFPRRKPGIGIPLAFADI